MTVHPRLRGELNCYRAARRDYYGSSPLARGTLNIPIGDLTVSRFIPACAGNSTAAAANIISAPVHPRLRGELELGRVVLDSKDGSSPLARGTHDNDHLPPFGSRFIPACAGNSLRSWITFSWTPVHPRLRGELR